MTRNEILTTVHKSGEKTYKFPLHAFGGCKELNSTVSLAVDFQTKEEWIEKLHPGQWVLSRAKNEMCILDYGGGLRQRYRVHREVC